MFGREPADILPECVINELLERFFFLLFRKYTYMYKA